MNNYHVFRKQRVKNGRIIHKWRYYFTVNGKQAQKACKGCQTKEVTGAFF
jgi:limonene-1,2-epoxide hydrolase